MAEAQHGQRSLVSMGAFALRSSSSSSEEEGATTESESAAAPGEVGAAGAGAPGEAAPNTSRRLREWAFDDTWDVAAFAEEVPEPAMDFPFELDAFQKRAVRRVHREEHVLVAAHTSAGKTAVAEYAIAHALKQGMRAIYTSPIKALSNQKFREFTKRFEGVGSVGIITGDVAVNPDAGCVIMTTEILRSMLYRGDQKLNTVKSVIFDEVHYVNDAERGVVWEEVIILLPDEVSMIMLSATVPNYREFAGWVGRTKLKAVYTVHTTYRPTPLRHFLHFSGQTLPLMDADGFHVEAFGKAAEIYKEKFKPPARKVRHLCFTFESRPFGMLPMKGDTGEAASCYVVEKVNHNDPSKPAWRLGVRPGYVLIRVGSRDVRRLALEQIQQVTKEVDLPVVLEFEVPPKERDKEKDKEKPQEPPQPKPQTRDSRERAETQRLQRLLRELEAGSLLPATVFVFSRRRVEAIAGEMPNLDVCTAEEKSKVHLFLKSSFQRLCEADRQLPQVKYVTELAKRGMGIHHGGLLPLVKEAVELMFSRGLVKILLATETFAMGVNMPARSVIFTSWYKHDGVNRRRLLPGEYTQMAGRAGRRGLDDEGSVFLLCGDEPPDQRELTEILTHKAERLSSRFRVTLAMILQLRRFSQSGVSVEDVLGRSFLENGRALRRPGLRRDLVKRREELEGLAETRCLHPGAPPMADYEALEAEARTLGARLHERLYERRSRDRAFCPGRALRAHGAFASSYAAVLEVEGGEGRGIRVAALVRRPAAGDVGEGREGVAAEADDEAEAQALRQRRGRWRGRGGAGEALEASEAEQAHGSEWTVVVETVPLEGVMQLFEQCLDPQLCRRAAAEEPRLADVGDGTSLAEVGAELLRLVEEGARSLDGGGGFLPLVVSKVTRQADMDFYDTMLRQQELQVLQESSLCHHCPYRELHLRQQQRRSTLGADIEDLGRELGAESLGLLPQLHAREAVLRELGCIDQSGLITLKGRAATEVLSGDEITIAEVVFHNTMSGFTAQEVAAAISAFVFPDKVDDEAQEVPVPHRVQVLYDRMLKHHHHVDALHRKHGVDIDPEEFARSCSAGLMGITYRWACGEPLAQIMLHTWLQEGTIVRAIVRAEELLRKLQDVAKLLGNDDMRKVFKEAAELIHRDIAFVPSLYIE